MIIKTERARLTSYAYPGDPITGKNYLLIVEPNSRKGQVKFLWT